MATVIFKPTELCNARCIYCDVVHSKTPRSPSKMPLETLECFFVRINEFLLERPEEQMEVIWHGGEPFLLGPEYFERALEFQTKHCAATSNRIVHNLQSNLTLFSRKFTSVLKRLGIHSIGTSYDPIGNLRGLGKERDARAYNKMFLDAISLLEEEGFNWGIIYVVTRLSLSKPLEIFNFLTNLSPKGAFMINAVLLYERGLEDLKISPDEFADFLGAIFPTWWKHRDEWPLVEPFASYVHNLVEGGSSVCCSDSGACANSHINIAPDGSVSQCGRSASWDLLKYGSILARSFSQIMADPLRTMLLERTAMLPQNECKDCRFWRICHGGCPLDSWSATGSFLHKSEWCHAKKHFIEKYFEPTVLASSAKASVAVEKDDWRKTRAGQADNGTWPQDQSDVGELTWINPMGGLGDALMLSGVLKLVVEKDPSKRFNLVARTKYRQILEDHPAIAHIGYPPPGARLITTSYWDYDDFHLGDKRAFTVLARLFGLEPPVEERLFIPGELSVNPILMAAIPWKRYNVLISQSSDSPKKQMTIQRWESLVEMLQKDDVGVVQATKSTDRYVRGAYSLNGLTAPRELIALMRHFDVVVCGDSFVMHAAHLCNVPAVVLWGPTDNRIYGYPGQIHLQAKQCSVSGGCKGLYEHGCPQTEAHCLSTLPLEAIHKCIMDALQKRIPTNLALELPG